MQKLIAIDKINHEYRSSSSSSTKPSSIGVLPLLLSLCPFTVPFVIDMLLYSSSLSSLLSGPESGLAISFPFPLPPIPTVLSEWVAVLCVAGAEFC